MITRVDEEKLLLMRVVNRVNRSLCSTQEGLNEALNRTDERKELE